MAGVFLIIVMITVIIILLIPPASDSNFISFFLFPFFSLFDTIRETSRKNCLSFALLVQTRHRDDEETEFLFIEREKCTC